MNFAQIVTRTNLNDFVHHKPQPPWISWLVVVYPQNLHICIPQASRRIDPKRIALAIGELIYALAFVAIKHLSLPVFAQSSQSAAFEKATGQCTGHVAAPKLGLVGAMLYPVRSVQPTHNTNQQHTQ